MRYHSSMLEQPSSPQLERRAPLPPMLQTTPYVTLEELKTKLLEIGLADNALVLSALAQAHTSHWNQPRDSGGPYLEEHIYPVTLSAIEHELRVGNRVSAKLVATCLTHDVPEDDLSMPLPNFREVFGKSTTHTLKPGRSVSDLVEPLTKLPPEQYPGATSQERKEARNAAYHAGLYTAEYETKIAKLADRYMNVCSLQNCETVKILDKIRETEQHYLPLAKLVSPYYFEAISERLDVLKDWLRQKY